MLVCRGRRTGGVNNITRVFCLCVSRDSTAPASDVRPGLTAFLIPTTSTFGQGTLFCPERLNATLIAYTHSSESLGLPEINYFYQFSRE